MKTHEIIETRGANRSVEHHRSLLEINNALITNLGLDELLRAVSQVLRRAIPFDGASLTIPDWVFIQWQGNEGKGMKAVDQK